MEPIKKPIIRSKFLGLTGMQTPESYDMWEQLIFGQRFQRIIEFGTWDGALSLYFALFCLDKGMQFYTYDRRDYFDTPLKRIIQFQKFYEKLDIFKNVEKIGALISQPGQTLLFCDNGNKIREFNIFAPYLKSGDIIAVHDWGWEIKMEDIIGTCIAHNLKVVKIPDNDPEKTFIEIFKRI